MPGRHPARTEAARRARRSSGAGWKTNTTEVRTEYSKHVVRHADGYMYNPAIDTLDDPRNRRRLTHGTYSGYDVARCRCPKCKPVGQAANERKTVNRIARALDRHRSMIAEILTASLGQHVATADIDNGTQRLLSCGEIRNKTRGTLQYAPAAIGNALQLWLTTLPSTSPLADDEVSQLAAALIGRLNP